MIRQRNVTIVRRRCGMLSYGKCIIMIVIILCGLRVLFLLYQTHQLIFYASDERLEGIMDTSRRVNTKRISLIENVCRRYNLGMYKDTGAPPTIKYPPAPQYTVFYILEQHNISYCPIYKAGSTTWIYNLCTLMGLSREDLTQTKEQLSSIARYIIPVQEYPEADKALSSTVKLLVVRHPFERLLSAYRDKLENSRTFYKHGTLFFHQKYGVEIVQKYRDYSRPLPKPPHQIIRRTDVPQPSGEEPTFREFVDYLIDTDLASYGDDHWMPYYLYCTPCSVKYDFVQHVETLKYDQLYMFSEMKWDNILKPLWLHHNNVNKNASRIYFSQLNKKRILKLYEKFKLDFELFGYSPDRYFTYATSPD